MNYEPVIGLEIHAELNTKTKMFCRCQNDPFHSQPNANICPVCLGLPGALPVANKAAVESTVKVGLALNCQVAHHSKWDRKNYFYPDLPKGYQISQYDLPLCENGQLAIRNEPIRITRIHLEEDTGTLQHPKEANYSLVNYNRSGVPLLELVTEPDIHNGKTARLFAEEYQRILRNLGVANADMEKGEMRVEVNISLRATSNQPPATSNQPLGTKVEIKNLNSFRSLERAIEYEINRQTKLLEAGEPVTQETRGWHDEKQLTFSQRVKEGAADYRYFPEPDLPPLELSAEFIDNIKSQMPLLPEARRQEYLKQGLSPAQAEVLVNDAKLSSYYNEATMSGVDKKLTANWVINEAADRIVPAEELSQLLVILEKGEISTKIAKDVLNEMKTSGQGAKEIITAKGLRQESDSSAIEAIVKDILAQYPKQVAEYKAGKQQIFFFLVGQAMRAAKGQANPQVLNKVLKRKL